MKIISALIVCMLTLSTIKANDDLAGSIYYLAYDLKSDELPIENDTSKPIRIGWNVLEDIGDELKYFPEIDAEIYAPVFSPQVKSLDGKRVVIRGFVIPFDERADRVALSANPYAACFFCGKAGPASLMTMYFKNDNKRYKIDDYKLFTGILELNSTDVNEFYYILREAEEVL